MTNHKQSNMFSNGDDLPLFSGTPQSSTEKSFEKKEVYKQGTLYTCPICKDTGYYELEISSGSKVIDRSKNPCSFCDAGKKYRKTHS